MNRRLIIPLILVLTFAALAFPMRLLSSLAAVLPFHRAPSGCTLYSGTITSQTWSGCAEISGQVVLATNETLTITPGTFVFFDLDASLRVNGKLLSLGDATLTGTVTLTSNSAFPSPGDWEYIHFTNSSLDNPECDTSGSLLQYTIVEYGGGAVTGDNGAIRIQNASPCIIHSLIHLNAADAIHIWSSTTPHDISPPILYNQIVDNGIPGFTTATGIYLRSIGLSQSVTFLGNDIERNTNTGISIDVGTNSNITLQENIIKDNTTANSGGGIYLNANNSIINKNIILNNTATQNGGGIYFAVGPQSIVFVTENVFAGNTAGNAGGGIYLCDGCGPAIFNNDFCQNFDVFDNDFYNGNNVLQNTVNGRNNYWVEGILQDVETHVYHAVDDPNLGLVDYSNIKFSPSLLGAPYCLELTPTPTPTDTLIPTDTPTDTPTPTDTLIPTATWTPTFTDTPTDTPTKTSTPTNIPTNTATLTLTPTPTFTPTPTATWTPTLTPTPTPPPPIYLPFAPRPPNPTPTPSPTPVFFPGPVEAEPNDSTDQANGNLISGQLYLGLPNNGSPDTGFRDYFKIRLDNPGSINIDLTNHPLESVNGTQIQLYYLSLDHRVALDLLPPYHIQYTGPAGTYYIYIYNDVSKCTLPGIACQNYYTLSVNYP